MHLFLVITDCIVNFFLFLTLDLFLNHFAECISPKKQFPLKISYIFLWIILCILPSIPYGEFARPLTYFIYALCIVKGHFCKRLLAFIKHQAYYYIGSTVIVIVYTLLTMDITIFDTNEVYAQYTSIIGNYTLYIALCMYIILRKLSNLPTGKLYKRYFLATTGLIIVSLVVCSMILGSNLLNQEDVVPLLFALLLIVAFLCISIYRKIISILEENTFAKIEVEKNALQQDYISKVEENLKNTSILRHDFKNHLIVIQNYANQNKLAELQQYINSIHSSLTPTELINTPSPMLSSLLNAKNEDCKARGISLKFEQDFKQITMDDFHLVTILSNMLDNAITAAAKAENKWITLKIIDNHSYLEIDCTNSHMEQIKAKNQIFKTTKVDEKGIHGLGIMSIRRAVNDLNGEMDIEYDDTIFHINILVPNYK